ncbi:winged helix-turn-helix transcriptional regulator [Candidatus Micrarchaeota archaeon]|nr:winged helix-turn-helix transcriptional regulator [Candidatus Micrarchaeota archaeon]
MKFVMVAVIGEDSDAEEYLYKGLKEFPTNRIILITEEKHLNKTKKIKEKLDKTMNAEIETIPDARLETVFQTIYKLKQNNKQAHLILNIETDYETSCIALSASFVNGVQAIGFSKGEIIAYPIMKFSYYSALSDKKLKLLETIYKNKIESFEQLSKLAGISLPLVTYHVRGSKNASGLEQLGLVETSLEKQKISVSLTSLGKLIIKGYIEVECNDPQCEKKRNATKL